MTTDADSVEPSFKRPAVAASEQLPQEIEVSGCSATWLNQTYEFRATTEVDEFLRSDWPHWKLSHRGASVYFGRTASPKGPGSHPYMWYDWKNRQWKLATVGFPKSHYLCALRAGGRFPQDLGKWQAGPPPEEEDPLFPASVRRWPGAISVAAVSGTSPSSSSSAPGPADAADAAVPSAPGPSAGCRGGGDAIPALGRLSDPPAPSLLTSEMARDFVRDGFVVVPSACFGNLDLARRAFRLTNIVIRDAVERGTRENGLTRLRDYVVKDRDPHWGACGDLFSECPALRALVREFMGAEPEKPRRCQLAIIFPDGGGVDADFSERADSRPAFDYHIDGRGRIPNGFSLLVGVALSDQPGHCRSWGGLTVFPGSHRRSDLHMAYPAQKRGEVQERTDIGPGKQLRLSRGDVVLAHSLIAHRPSENWSEAVRSMAYLRLAPADRRADWEDGLLQDPFMNLRGVERAAAGPPA